MNDFAKDSSDNYLDPDQISLHSVRSAPLSRCDSPGDPEGGDSRPYDKGRHLLTALQLQCKRKDEQIDQLKKLLTEVGQMGLGIHEDADYGIVSQS